MYRSQKSSVCVTDSDVEYRALGALPEAVLEDVSSRLISQGVIWRWRRVGRCSAGRTCCGAVAIEDGWFDHDSHVGKGQAAKVCPLVAGVVMADADESLLLAVERMLDCESLSTAITVGGEVRWSGAIPEGDVVEPLLSHELCAREAVRYGC